MNETVVVNVSNPLFAAILHPIPEVTARCFLLTFGLIGLMTLGISGCSSQFGYQCYLQYVHESYHTFVPNIMLLIIKAIYVIQFACCLTIPGIIMDVITEHWIFGGFPCVLQFLVMDSARTITAWLIVLLFHQLLYSVERRKRFRNFLIIVSGCLIGLLLQIPSFKYISLTANVVMEVSGAKAMVTFNINKCSMNFNNSGDQYIVETLSFLVDYIFPMIFCVGFIVCLEHYRWKNQVILSTNDNRIKILLIIVASIYFLGTSSHWVMMQIMLFEDHTFRIKGWETSLIADSAIVGSYFVSATIWIPLGFIAKYIFLEMELSARKMSQLGRLPSDSSNSTAYQSLPEQVKRGEYTLSFSSFNLLNVKRNFKKPTFKDIKLSSRRRTQTTESTNLSE